MNMNGTVMAAAGNASAPSGIDAVGPLAWGSHFCQFYEEANDLSTVLVPYFKAGLDNNEQCIWVASAPFSADEARNALRAAVPDLDRLEKHGRIDIVDHRAWYERHGRLSAEETMAGWLSREQQALLAGRNGLRVTGNTFWLECEQWHAFSEYEHLVNEGFQGRRIIALCSYCLSRCRGSDVLDVVRNHQFAMARRFGCWEVVENAAIASAKAALKQANDELESRVAERTAELQRALAVKDALHREVHHRVRNNLQVIGSLLNLRSRQFDDERLQAAFEDTANRIAAIGHVHHCLYEQSDDAVVAMEAYLHRLARAIAEGLGVAQRVTIEVRAPEIDLPLSEATLIGMIATEALLNAIRHGFAGGREGAIAVSLKRAAGRTRLTVRDDGVGLRAAPAALKTSGLKIAATLASQVEGRLNLRSDNGAVFDFDYPDLTRRPH